MKYPGQLVRIIKEGYFGNNMNLQQYIQEQIYSMKDYWISTAEFQVCLDDTGLIVNNSMNTIKFTLTLRPDLV